MVESLQISDWKVVCSVKHLFECTQYVDHRRFPAYFENRTVARLVKHEIWSCHQKPTSSTLAREKYRSLRHARYTSRWNHSCQDHRRPFLLHPRGTNQFFCYSVLKIHVFCIKCNQVHFIVQQSVSPMYVIVYLTSDVFELCCVIRCAFPLSVAAQANVDADIGCKDGGRRQAKQKKEEGKKKEKKGKKKKGKRTPTVELQAPNGSIEHEEESSIQSVWMLILAEGRLEPEWLRIRASLSCL